MKRIIALLVFSCACAMADGDYIAFKKVALSGSTNVLTVTQPASGAKTVRFTGATFFCNSTSACDFTLERDGAAPTGASTAVTTCGSSEGNCPFTSNTPTAKALVYSSSDVGAGAMAIPYTVQAGGWITLDLKKLPLFGNGSAKNVSIRPASMTATVTMHLYYTETSN